MHPEKPPIAEASRYASFNTELDQPYDDVIDLLETIAGLSKAMRFAADGMAGDERRAVESLGEIVGMLAAEARAKLRAERDRLELMTGQHG